MPIGPPSLGGSGAIPLPAPPRYPEQEQQQQQLLSPQATDAQRQSTAAPNLTSVARQQQPLPHHFQQQLQYHHQQQQHLHEQQRQQEHFHQQLAAQHHHQQQLLAHQAASNSIVVSSHSTNLTTSTSNGSGETPVFGAGGVDGVSRPPPPPPPLPRPPHCIHGRPLPALLPAPGDRSTNGRTCLRACARKYVLLCACSGLCSVLLGSLYLVIYLLLRSYTTSLQYFETMPTYVPATVQIMTGLLVGCFVRRKHRLALLVKVCGCMCLVCAVMCVVVTVTTTVVHMNRLQTLHDCEYIPHTVSCTCTTYSGLYEPGQEALRYVFSQVSSCDVIHGPLYACLRALFGLSVIGILVSIFSCMLVYQLLSHEKKKMYWEQLEARRRQLYRRPYTLPSSASGALDPGMGVEVDALSGVLGGSRADCGCCSDDYGFPAAAPEALYPYALWDTLDDRCWSSGVLSPDSDGQAAGARSLLLHLHHPPYARGGCVDEGVPPQAQHSGVLLRPFLHRGLEGRIGLRRLHPGSRPLSDPGMAMHLPPYPPPPFPDAFMPMGYPDAFPGYLWGPPPPYSQPTSTENIPSVASLVVGPMSPSHAVDATSPTHHPDGTPIMMSPMHRPPTLADLMRGTPSNTPVRSLSSPINPSGLISSPGHLLSRPPRARHKGGGDNVGEDGEGEGGGDSDPTFDGTNSLPLRHRARRLPLGHVKSLGDVTENKHDESLEVIFCDGKEIASLDKIHNEMMDRRNNSKHLKSVSDPKSVYSVGKMEPESEIYFADVSSCVSLRPDGEEVMYYSDPTSSGSQQYSLQQQLYHDPSQNYMSNLASSISSSHMYEQVQEENEDDENGSHHPSDDTMIVHTSSSDPSMTGENEAVDTENTYSVISPATDFSSASPMVIDTDAYSPYTPITPSATQALSNPILSPATLVALTASSSILSPTITSPQQAVTPNNNTSLTQSPCATNANETVTLSSSPLKSNLNLHHPLHPVRHPQHQAYHHQLSHNHSNRDGDNNACRRRNDCGNGNHKPFKKSHCKKASKKHTKKEEVSDEPRYESVLVSDNPAFKEGSKSTEEVHLHTSSAPKLQSSNVPTRAEKNQVQAAQVPFAHISNLESNLSPAPSKHRHHRQHTHHKHPPHHNPHHHHHPHGSPLHPLSSSSSSSSVSSPRSPTTSLPQEDSSDLNGNVPSCLNSPEAIVAPNFPPVVNQDCSSKGVNSSTASSSSNSQLISSFKSSSNNNPVVSDKKQKMTCVPAPSSNLPVKKPRPNLSLPLRKLMTSPDSSVDKMGLCSSGSKRETKASSRASKSGELSSSKDKRKTVDKDKEAGKTSSKSESRKKSSKESVSREGRLDTGRSSTKSAEHEGKPARKSRKTKMEGSVTPKRELTDLSVTSPVKMDNSAAEKVEIVGQDQQVGGAATAAELSDQGTRPDAARRPANVHHLLRNLKSVNV